jgi:hypothetical protein
MFYLIVDSGSVISRIDYFNSHTSTFSLLYLPAILSIAIVLSSPWVRYLFNLVSSKPLHLIELLNARSEHQVLIEKKTLENLRARLLASKEDELIDRAVRDQKVEALEDEQLRDRLRQEIDQLRSERDALRKVESRSKGLDLILGEEALLLLAAAAEGDGMVTHMRYLDGSRIQADGKDFMEDNSPRTAAKWEAAINELVKVGYIEDKTGKGEVYNVTRAGYDILDKKLSQ